MFRPPQLEGQRTAARPASTLPEASPAGLLLPHLIEPARLAAAPEARDRAQSAPAPAPTIQVTIGRIEVRAVHPAPPSAQSQRPPREPALSLEAYLKQRSEGEP